MSSNNKPLTLFGFRVVSIEGEDPLPSNLTFSSSTPVTTLASSPVVVEEDRKKDINLVPQVVSSTRLEPRVIETRFLTHEELDQLANKRKEVAPSPKQPEEVPAPKPASPQPTAPPLQQQQQQQCGVGIALIQDHETGLIVVKQVFPGGPAGNAGIQTGDLIHAVDGVEVCRVPGESVARLIVGPVGSRVDLLIETRDGSLVTHRLIRQAAIDAAAHAQVQQRERELQQQQQQQNVPDVQQQQQQPLQPQPSFADSLDRRDRYDPLLQRHLEVLERERREFGLPPTTSSSSFAPPPVAASTSSMLQDMDHYGRRSAAAPEDRLLDAVESLRRKEEELRNLYNAPPPGRPFDIPPPAARMEYPDPSRDYYRDYLSFRNRFGGPPPPLGNNNPYQPQDFAPPPFSFPRNLAATMDRESDRFRNRDNLPFPGMAPPPLTERPPMYPPPPFGASRYGAPPFGADQQQQQQQPPLPLPPSPFNTTPAYQQQQPPFGGYRPSPMNQPPLQPQPLFNPSSASLSRMDYFRSQLPPPSGSAGGFSGSLPQQRSMPPVAVDVAAYAPQGFGGYPPQLSGQGRWG